jgi:hypothetical protein
VVNFSAPIGLALDSGGLLYVLGGGPQASIAVYASTVSGAATPFRLLAGSQTQIGNAQDLAVDPYGDIFVTEGSGTSWAVAVFNAGSAGNTMPVQTITASNGVSLNQLQGIASDGYGDIFVVNYPPSGTAATIVEFAAGATGNAVPLKTLAGPSTAMMNVTGLTLDASANIYVVGQSSTTAPYGLTVSKFLSTASGNASPNNILSSPSWTLPAYGQIAAF